MRSQERKKKKGAGELCTFQQIPPADPKNSKNGAMIVWYFYSSIDAATTEKDSFVSHNQIEWTVYKSQGLPEI
jgi:hypothetical protein